MAKRKPSTSAIYAYAEELRRTMLDEYRLVQEAEYAAAVEATCTVMLNAAGWASPYDEWEVFHRSGVMLDAYGSEELKLHLKKHPRTTRTAFEKQWLENYLGRAA